MKKNNFNNSVLLGTVQDVSGTSVSVTLNDDNLTGLVFVNGNGYKVGQVGSFVKIPNGYIDLFGIVTQVGASAVPDNIADIQPYGRRWLKIQLVGEGYSNGDFFRGISQYPTIDDEVHLVSESDLIRIYGRKGKQNHLVKIGHIAGSESIEALVDINKLITRHSAVLGTTGSGKSTTVSSLLNSLSDPKRFPSARIVVLDLHGEYGKALADRSNIFKISPDLRNPIEKPLFIPFWAMSFDELISVTFGDLPQDGKAKNAILEKVLDCKLETIKKYPKNGITEQNINVDSPIPFSLNKLWYELYCEEFGTYYSDAAKTPSKDNWAYEKDDEDRDIIGNPSLGVPPRFKKVKNIKEDPEKINYLPNSLNIRAQLDNLGSKLRIPRYSFLLRPGNWTPESDGNVAADLPELISEWIGLNKPITILDLSGVPSSILNNIVGILLRVLYDALFWARNLSQGGRERPLMIVMEEAHAYLNYENGLASSIVQRIVKEGRKYGVGAMIVSQRPSEVNSTILSQCGTFFAMRLNNSTDRSHVTGVVADNLDGLTNMLPILKTGEAIILGEAVGLPMRTIIQPPPKDKRPDSSDPIVSDIIAPDDSQSVGGWGNIISYDDEVKSKIWDEVSLVWRQQNPVLPIKTEEEE